ncbi:hypothetical protein [Mucilaginibacter agri]|uniref:Uncharacterized protein n=1 Tax=Mucilaginibacter agri TaxID=2695265 RepID=A0A966DTD9_9SPHI|nr:hypothetical protein [Mucilaginibacter agri]NCD71153.1 hypothetical protein [Mucilaginibacter agri]
MLQNRVDPYGNLIKTPHRGAWLGNRGVIHNEQKQIVRQFKIKVWITCALEFRGRHREVMTPNRWTELFFLDEATAFSAGHRPCFQCRYLDHQRFKEFWLKGNPQYGFDMKTPVTKIDEIIHTERVSADKSKVSHEADVDALPDGTFVNHEDKPYLLKQNRLYLWTPGGYGEPIDLHDKTLTVLTPKSIVNMIKAGYTPQMAV